MNWRLTYIFTVLIMVSGLTSGPAFAAPPPASDGHGGGNNSARSGNVHTSSYQVPNDIIAAEQAAIEEANPPENGRYVDMPNLNVPVIHGDQLIGYAYVLVRYHLPENVDEYRIREKSHFLMDELVRASHQQPFVRNGRETYDSAATLALWRDVSGQIVDPAYITDIQIIGSDIRFLRD